MKFAHKSIRSILHAHAFGFGVFVVLFSFCFFAGGLVAANGQTVIPSDSHIVSLYLDGQETVAPTRAATVGDFINKASIKLYEADLVEPSLDTLINSDNFRIQIYRARPVTIVDGDNIQRVLTPHQSPQLIAKNAGITVYPEDKLTFSTASNFVQEAILGEKLTITRATPVTISLYSSSPIPYRTQAKTVGELLTEKDIKPEAGATVVPATNSPITAGLAIFVSKMGKTVVSAEEPVDFAIESTNDPNQALGRVIITKAGVPGKKQMVYEIELRDGKETSRKVLQEVITVQPQAQIQTRGTKSTVDGDKLAWMSAAGIAESDFGFVDFIIDHESHWRPSAINSGGCTGLGQSCPGSKLAAVCPDWQIDPACQLRFFSGYATSRYGSWYGAYSAWTRQGWW